MTEDIVLERYEKGLCPICAKELGEEFKRVLYKGKKVWICTHHIVPLKPDVKPFKPVATG